MRESLIDTDADAWKNYQVTTTIDFDGKLAYIKIHSAFWEEASATIESQLQLSELISVLSSLKEKLQIIPRNWKAEMEAEFQNSMVISELESESKFLNKSG